MATSATATNDILHDIDADPRAFLDFDNAALWSLDYADIERIQLRHAQARFEALRSKVGALGRLAEDVGIDRIASLEDLAALSFPHTMYKSYSAADIEAGRFDRVTRWLQTMTAVDLSQVDATGCDSIEAWLDRIEAVTPLRPVISSGTSGKISLYPRTLDEEDRLFLNGVLRTYDAYGDEPGIALRSGAFPLASPLHYDAGRHNLPVVFRMLRKNVYGGDEAMVVTARRGRVTADEMWLSSKLRRAQANGEQLELSPFQAEIAAQIAERERAAGDAMDGFVEHAVKGLAGQPILLMCGWFGAIQIAQALQARGIRPDWAPGTVMLGGGGLKGFTFPDGWRELVVDMFPYPVKQAYMMTECSSPANRCAHDNLHPLPWAIPILVDPESGEPLPRVGTRTGRMVYFDLLVESMWAGTVTGDEVTVHWDGGCPCGRQGPFYTNNVRRFSEASGGDDKITCARTPQAYDNLVEYAQQVL